MMRLISVLNYLSLTQSSSNQMSHLRLILDYEQWEVEYQCWSKSVHIGTSTTTTYLLVFANVRGTIVFSKFIQSKSLLSSGFTSKNYLQTLSTHESYTNSGTPGYVVGTGIALGVLAILLIAFGVIAVSILLLNSKILSNTTTSTHHFPNTKCHQF